MEILLRQPMPVADEVIAVCAAISNGNLQGAAGAGGEGGGTPMSTPPASPGDGGGEEGLTEKWRSPRLKEMVGCLTDTLNSTPPGTADEESQIVLTAHCLLAEVLSLRPLSLVSKFIESFFPQLLCSLMMAVGSASTAGCAEAGAAAVTSLERFLEAGRGTAAEAMLRLLQGGPEREQVDEGNFAPSFVSLIQLVCGAPAAATRGLAHQRQVASLIFAIIKPYLSLPDAGHRIVACVLVGALIKTSALAGVVGGGPDEGGDAPEGAFDAELVPQLVQTLLSRVGDNDHRVRRFALMGLGYTSSLFVAAAGDTGGGAGGGSATRLLHSITLKIVGALLSAMDDKIDPVACTGAQVRAEREWCHVRG